MAAIKCPLIDCKHNDEEICTSPIIVLERVSNLPCLQCYTYKVKEG